MFPLLFGFLAGILVLDPVIAQPAKTMVDKAVVNSFNEPNGRSAFNISANEPLVIEEGEKTLVYESAPQDSKIKFNALGLRWEGEVPDGSSADFYYKVDNGDWQKMEMMEEDEHFSNLMSADGNKAYFKAVLKREHEAGSSPKIESVKFYFLDTSQSEAVRSAKGSGGVISRAEWGADESYRFWSPQYAEPKKFVIHHTAGGDGGDDPAATVRAIYYWHAVVLGWGDIGYNYLIDGQGNVYEGRYGGDGVIGAHTYNSYENINYNDGTIGIAVMGCYDSEGCYAPDTFTKKIRKSLTDLMANKSKRLKIKPKGKSTIFGNKSYNIVGHKKLDYTLCPGDRISSKMKKIRNITRNKYKKKTTQWRGEYDESNIEIAYYKKNTYKATVKYKNTGTRTWKQKKTWLKMYNDNKEDKISRFSHKKSWQDIYGKFYFMENEVRPGETATFKFKIRTPKNHGVYHNVFKLFINKNRVYKSRHLITTRVD